MSDDHSWLVRLDGSTLPDRSLIGGKAWSIARIGSLGLPVPPAFVVTTEAYAAYIRNGGFPVGLQEELAAGIAWLEESTGRRFGAGPRPLLLSVRSGAAISMPGMMDTILNLGMNDEIERLVAAESNDAEFARDTHRRFIQLWGDIVCRSGQGHLPKHEEPAAWRAAVERNSGQAVPTDAVGQLSGAVAAVFESWNSRRARRYRDHHGISHEYGTAVTVQAMVFGNMDEKSGTGVVFSRNPGSGEPDVFGQFLSRAQGEDIVSGAFSPRPLHEMSETMPEVHARLIEVTKALEVEDKVVQDIEFTIERGRLYLLQSRAAKLAPLAAVRASVDMAEEGLIDRRTAIQRVMPDQINQLLAPGLSDETRRHATRLASGESACPGVGIGVVVDDPDEAERRSAAGESIVLVRSTTSPHDVHGMIAATATITEEGGSTSHAAVVSRALGRPCVVGCGAGVRQALVGKLVTVDGKNGLIYEGALPVVSPDISADNRLGRLAEWARVHSPLAVYTPNNVPDEPVIDLDGVDGGKDPERLVALLPSLATGKFSGVRGGAIQSAAAVQAAARCGFSFIVAEPVLPCLIAAAQTSAASGDTPCNHSEGTSNG